MKKFSKTMRVAIASIAVTFLLGTAIALKLVTGGGYEAVCLVATLLAIIALVSSPEADPNYGHWKA